jgi:trehalose-6-phosphate synthase
MSPTADLILANRAYIDHNVPPDGGEPPPAGTGGLLVAVSPTISRDGSTTWIGVGRGAFDREWTDPGGRERIALAGGGTLAHRRLFFDDKIWAGHYAETANGFFWPLFHLVRAPLPRITSYFPRPVAPSEAAWSAFRGVNQAFAEASLSEGRRESCWIHDYQLGLVPRFARELGYPGRIGFFLHTPFPALDVALQFVDGQAEWQFAEWIRGVLGADLAGFQTRADVARFREAAIKLGLAEPDGEQLRVGARRVTVAAFPVGIDVAATIADGVGGELPSVVRQAGDFARPLLIGLERADYTKGIPERLRAIAALYREGLAFSYVGIASPTREGVAAYQRFQAEVDTLTRECEALAPPGGLFVNTAMALPFSQVLALLRTADIVCTSSLADGMNLVPLQAVAMQSALPQSERGVVLTGQDAGVASAFAGFENDGLVPFDPLDHPAFVQTLRRALGGTLPSISDRLVEAVRANDATRWGERYLVALQEAATDG